MRHPTGVALPRRRQQGWLTWVFLLGILLVGVLWLVRGVVGFPWVSPAPPATQVEARAAPGTWPSLGGGPEHLHAVETPLPSFGREVAWQFVTQGPLVASPVVAEGKVFLATSDRRVLALDAETGALVWESPVTGPVDTTPTVAGGLVYVGLRDKRLLALDGQSGATVWTFWTGGPIFSSPVVKGGVVYVGSGDGYLYALDAATGRKRWSFRVGGWVIMSPAVGEKVAIVAGNRSIFAVDLRHGRSRLRYDTVTPPTGIPALSGPLAYVASEDGVLRAIDTQQREIPGERFARWWRVQLFIWEIMGEPPPQKGFVWAKRFPRGSLGNGIAVADDTVYLLTRTGTLYALDTHTGTERWKAEVGEGLASAPIWVGGILLVGTEKGRILQVNPHSGHWQELFRLPGHSVTALVPAGPYLYVATSQGILYALR